MKGNKKRRELGAKAAGLCLHTLRSLNGILFKNRLLHESCLRSVGSLPMAEPAFVKVEYVSKHLLCSILLINVLLSQSSLLGRRNIDGQPNWEGMKSISSCVSSCVRIVLVLQQQQEWKKSPLTYFYPVFCILMFWSDLKIVSHKVSHAVLCRHTTDWWGNDTETHLRVRMQVWFLFNSLVTMKQPPGTHF